MDLLVVCADAGLSMEAALDRVGRELADSYRSLCANIHMATLEMRAGRTLSETLDHLADRLGLEEARSFATLLQQSEKLGSSLTEALRVYSDDMRHKRLSRAEEKAYSLPAKLSVPLTLCVFPGGDHRDHAAGLREAEARGVLSAESGMGFSSDSGTGSSGSSARHPCRRHDRQYDVHR